MIAALVRLADELDEDFRRADPDLQRRLNVPEESRFFWEFCQRINGIKPDLISHNINIDVRFEADDVGRNVVVNGQEMPFIVAFGDKLAKMNRERRTVNSFLPEAVRYRYLKLSVKPLPGRQEWKHPREFVFGEHTLASEFVSTFSEFLAGDLDQATVTLNRLDEVAAPGTPADAAEPVLSPAPRFTPLQLVVTPEPRGDQLRLKVVNQGDGGQFSAKVISIVDNKGKSVVPQHWPIPWDNHAVTPTTITSLGKDYLDFAEYDRENIRTTKIVILQQVLRHGRAAPARRPVGEYDMQFSSLPDPIGVNFAIQGVTTTRLLFTVTIRISREDPPGQADWTFAIGVDEEEVVCDIIATPVLQGRRLPSVWLQPQQVNTSVPIASPTAISA